MFSVCSTAPMHGTAKYSSKWRWLFHANVPTRSPCSMPSARSARASRSTRSETSAWVAWYTDDSSAASVTTFAPWL